jgi:mRNA interferase HigB
MRVIAKRTLAEFWTSHADSKGGLEAWYADVSKAEWKTAADITAHYSNSSLLANSRVCFNIKGNSYRLIVEVRYNAQVVYIKFVGTHTEYNDIDANTVSLY